MVIGTFTRFCWKCKTNKAAPGGRLTKQKMWNCAACVEEGKAMKPMKWNKGAPPSIGWWPTSVPSSSLTGFRWWDGKCWSWPAFAHESAAKAAHWAGKKEDKYNDIEWVERPANWPERSRT